MTYFVVWRNKEKVLSQRGVFCIHIIYNIFIGNHKMKVLNIDAVNNYIREMSTLFMKRTSILVKI